jgi:hypothetical protein
MGALLARWGLSSEAHPGVFVVAGAHSLKHTLSPWTTVRIRGKWGMPHGGQTAPARPRRETLTAGVQDPGMGEGDGEASPGPPLPPCTRAARSGGPPDPRAAVQGRPPRADNATNRPF